MVIVEEIIIQIIVRLGTALAERLLNYLKNPPSHLEELSSYEASTKQAAIAQLLSVDNLISQSMELTMNNPDLSVFRSLDRIKSRLVTIRHQIEVAPLLNYPSSAVNVQDLIKNIATFQILVVYHSFAIDQSVATFRDAIEDDEDADQKVLLKEIRQSISTLENVWKLRPNVAISNDVAKALKAQMKNVSGDLIDLMDNITNVSEDEVKLAFKGVALKKPKFFKKAQYLESLGDLMLLIIKKSGHNSMSLRETREKLTTRYPNIDLSMDDLEAAGQMLYDNKLISQISEHSNIVSIHINPEMEKPSSVSPEINEIVNNITEKRRLVNNLFNSQYRTRLFKQNEMAIHDLRGNCPDEGDFNNKIQVITVLIDEIENKKINHLIRQKDETQTKISGSINILETFLSLYNPEYNQSLIQNLRNIMSLRSKKYPIHRDDVKWIKSLNYFGLQYPPNWSELWVVLLRKYLESLQDLMESIKN